MTPNHLSPENVAYLKITQWCVEGELEMVDIKHTIDQSRQSCKEKKKKEKLLLLLRAIFSYHTQFVIILHSTSLGVFYYPTL